MNFEPSAQGEPNSTRRPRQRTMSKWRVAVAAWYGASKRGQLFEVARELIGGWLSPRRRPERSPRPRARGESRVTPFTHSTVQFCPMHCCGEDPLPRPLRLRLRSCTRWLGPAFLAAFPRGACLSLSSSCTPTAASPLLGIGGGASEDRAGGDGHRACPVRV